MFYIHKLGYAVKHWNKFFNKRYLS